MPNRKIVGGGLAFAGPWSAPGRPQTNKPNAKYNTDLIPPPAGVVNWVDLTDTGTSQSVEFFDAAIPAGNQAYDVMIAFVTRWETINPAITAPAEFTHSGTQLVFAGSPSAKIDIYYKRLTSPDSGVYTFSWTGLMWSNVMVACFRGVTRLGDPINQASALATAGTYPAVATPLLPYAPGLLWFGTNDTAGSHTPPTGYTEVSDTADSYTMAYRLPGTPGTYSNSGASVSSSSAASSQLIWVQPDIPVAAFEGWGLPI